MNNYEKVKQMSLEEMKIFVTSSDCDKCIHDIDTCKSQLHTHCEDGIKEWLESEAEQTRWEKWIGDINVEVPKIKFKKTVDK